MKCPNCDSILQITERQNVEIDYCPNCRGVWLDRGELDKIIEYANRMYPASQRPADNDAGFPGRDMGYGGKRHDGYGYDKHKKKKGFLGDFFDFD